VDKCIKISWNEVQGKCLLEIIAFEDQKPEVIMNEFQTIVNNMFPTRGEN
jgi:hypothetical protein